ncbi:MAG TPA: hypothetical protein VFA37_06025 [Gaiellaceae bacterium]|nr:hypothetical protein [Gaiellaceae bacterium]
MKRFLEIGGVAAGVVLIAFGVAAIVLGVNGKNTVGNELKLQQITGTPDMTPKAITAEAKAAGLNIAATPIPTCSVANLSINSGDRARCFAQYMRIHTLDATHGIPYSQMGMYVATPGTPKSQLMKDGATDNTKYAAIDPTTKQPVSNGARNIWVTETALTTALNSSYMAEQMANFGIVVGIALLLSGIGFTILALGGALENEVWFFKRPAVKEASSARTTPLSV